jgi:hypothetical protein
VYDEIWDATFGRDPRFERTAAIDRVSAFCRASGIAYVDTLEALRAEARRTGGWVHYRKDAHPTPEGHVAIAEAVAHSGLFEPRTGQ